MDMYMNKIKEKIVFKEDELSRSKVLYGIVIEEDDLFIKVRTVDNNIFTVNKKYIIFRKVGGC